MIIECLLLVLLSGFLLATAKGDNKLFVGLLGVVLDVELVLEGDEFGLEMVELESVDDEIGSICGVGGTMRVDCANCELLGENKLVEEVDMQKSSSY